MSDALTRSIFNPEKEVIEPINKALNLLLKHTASTQGELQNDIIGAMGLMETAECGAQAWLRALQETNDER